MHVLSINGTEYKAIEDWPEMPTSKAIEVNQVIDDMPSLLRKLYDLSIKDSNEKETDELYAEVTAEDRIKHFPLFYGEIMRVLTTIPGEVMEGILWDTRTQFYKQYCEHLVQGIMFGDYSGIKNIKDFEWKDHTYLLPTSGHFLGNKDQAVPMEKESAIVFTEVADLEIYSEQLKGGKYEVAPNIISVMCRPEDEQYDEKVSLERAKEFLDLPMDIVWEVFFCIQQLLTISSQNILISKLRRELAMSKRQVLSPSGGTEGFSKSQSKGYLHVT